MVFSLARGSADFLSLDNRSSDQTEQPMGYRRDEEIRLLIHKIWGASRGKAELNVRSKPA